MQIRMRNTSGKSSLSKQVQLGAGVDQGRFTGESPAPGFVASDGIRKYDGQARNCQVNKGLRALYLLFIDSILC